MILERELYKSISTTRAVVKSLRAYFYFFLGSLFKRKSKKIKNDRERGLPELVSNSNCNGCGDCEVVCPTGSLKLVKDGDKLKNLYLDLKKCIFCGLCEEVCEPKAIQLTDYRPLSSHGESMWILDLANENERT